MFGRLTQNITAALDKECVEEEDDVQSVQSPQTVPGAATTEWGNVSDNSTDDASAPATSSSIATTSR